MEIPLKIEVMCPVLNVSEFHREGFLPVTNENDEWQDLGLINPWMAHFLNLLSGVTLCELYGEPLQGCDED